MRIYVPKNKRVDFSGRTSSSTPVVNHRCPRGEGSPMRGLILKKNGSNRKPWRRDVLVPIATFRGGSGDGVARYEKLHYAV
jgi:hypothetical protein